MLKQKANALYTCELAIVLFNSLKHTPAYGIQKNINMFMILD